MIVLFFGCIIGGVYGFLAIWLVYLFYMFVNAIVAFYSMNSCYSHFLGGPSPCGKTGLAPCRPRIFSSFFGYYFSFDAFVFYLSILYVFRFFYLCISSGAFHWISRHIPKREKKSKSPKSRLQNPDQKASKRVCPTSSYHSF